MTPQGFITMVVLTLAVFYVGAIVFLISGLR